MADGVVKGPWSEDEDEKLLSYIRKYGHRHWETLAIKAGLNRTGKSCRLRWFNCLRPGLRRGNISLQEQLIILQLHSRWGNRWAKIAECLPGRSDNEIKNYWRTRVQKQAKQLQCDMNSNRFNEIMHHLWIPQLAERVVQAQSESLPTTATEKLSNQSKPKYADQSFAIDPSIPSQESHQPSPGYNDPNENVIGCLSLAASLHGVDGYTTYAEPSCEETIQCEDCSWRKQGLESESKQELATDAWLDDHDNYSLESLLNDEEMVLLSQNLIYDDHHHHHHI